MPVFHSVSLAYNPGDVHTYEITKDPLKPTLDPLVKVKQTNTALRNWLTAVPTVPGQPVGSQPLLRIM